jgi:hypothetical protein
LRREFHTQTVAAAQQFSSRPFPSARKPALNPIFVLSMIKAQLTWLLCGERNDGI